MSDYRCWQGQSAAIQGGNKPLIPLLGNPLIERVIRAASEAGVDEFFVVVGHQGEQLSHFLEHLAQSLVIPITPLVNNDWDKDNGLSVLKAQEVLYEPFLLLMADHLFDPQLVKELMALELGDREVALVVDGTTRNPLIDMADVTRVKMEDDGLMKKIVGIGKELADFNGFDTGIFLCSPAIFEALQKSQEKNGDTSLSGAVRILAEQGRAKAMVIDGFWIDVDDPAAFKRAEQALLKRLADKSNDGPVARHLNRPFPSVCRKS